MKKLIFLFSIFFLITPYSQAFHTFDKHNTTEVWCDSAPIFNTSLQISLPFIPLVLINIINGYLPCLCRNSRQVSIKECEQFTEYTGLAQISNDRIALTGPGFVHAHQNDKLLRGKTFPTDYKLRILSYDTNNMLITGYYKAFCRSIIYNIHSGFEERIPAAEKNVSLPCLMPSGLFVQIETTAMDTFILRTIALQSNNVTSAITTALTSPACYNFPEQPTHELVALSQNTIAVFRPPHHIHRSTLNIVDITNGKCIRTVKIPMNYGEFKVFQAFSENLILMRLSQTHKNIQKHGVTLYDIQYNQFHSNIFELSLRPSRQITRRHPRSKYSPYQQDGPQLISTDPPSAIIDVVPTSENQLLCLVKDKRHYYIENWQPELIEETTDPN